jgi:hypothetical protein
MSVIINEFEIILDRPTASEETGGPALQSEESLPSRVLYPEDVVHIHQHNFQRIARVWAD